jgi:hypothetical protein
MHRNANPRYNKKIQATTILDRNIKNGYLQKN